MRAGEHDQLPLLLEAGPSSGQPGHAPESPVSVIRRLLRGRWKPALILAASLGSVFGVVGYLMSPPLYTSTGLVEVKPTLPSLMFNTDESRLPPMFESLVQAQAAYLGHPRVLDRAINDPSVREAGWPAGGEGLALLQDRLRVVSAKGQQIITVRVSFENAVGAARAVNAVLRAYRDIYGEQAGLTANQRELGIESRERTLQGELSAAKENYARQQEQFGPDVQDRAFEARITALDGINTKLSDVRLAIAEKEARAKGENAAPAPEGQAEPAVAAARQASEAEAYAATDEAIARFIADKARLQSDYDARSVRFGPRHVEMRSLQGQIDAKQREIDQRVEQLKIAGVVPGVTAGGVVTALALAERPLDELRSLESQYQTMKDALGREITDITRKRMALANMLEQVEEAKARLDETQKKLDEIRTERKSTEAGRISTQEGDIPFRASADKRVARAVMGVLGGGCLGFGIVMALGLVRGNYRYIEDIEHGVQAPLLGTLPELNTGDGENDELAAGSVHHVRNMLQLQHTRPSVGNARVYAITSAAAGEGKTSLSMALGMSFAAAGHRTLLIDADLYGRGLTKSLGLQGRDGVSEAATAADLNGEVHDAGFANVWVIPAGRSEAFDAQNLSKPRMEALLNKVRDEFDIVIVDTGPLLGSIEANLGAALADGVVLMVTRGQDSKLVRACLKRIASVGGVCAGLVFNRALRPDFERSVSSNSFRSNAPRLQGQTLPTPSRESSLLRALGSGKGDSGQQA